MHKQKAARFQPLGRNESGMSAMIIPFILTFLLLMGALAFGFWAFTGMQSYKNDSDKKSAAAVTVAEEALTKKLQAQFDEQLKAPFKTYVTPAAYGSVVIAYPRTYSGYVYEANQVGTQMGNNSFFHPDVVPSTVNEQTTAYAIRLQIVQRSYAQELKNFDSAVKQGTVRVTPFHAPKMPDVLGARVDGFIQNKKNGSMILLPLRDKTIKVWTEAQTFMDDFNNVVIPNLEFVP